MNPPGCGPRGPGGSVVGRPRRPSHLKAVLWINRTPFHLEAVEVRHDDGGTLETVAAEDRERPDALDGMYSARWATMPLVWAENPQPREYVAYVVPFGD